MKYSIDKLIEDYKKQEKIKYLFFWGHQPSKAGKLTKTCFSQWWSVSFSDGNYNYTCAEQYMMAKKALLFNDTEVFKEIMNSNHPKEMKALGRKIRNFNEEVWNENKYSIVVNGNYLKFSQNKDLKDFLINTENKVLVEASPYDGIWGIKMSVSNENIENPNFWRGENLLGFALMEVRDIICNKL